MKFATHSGKLCLSKNKEKNNCIIIMQLIMMMFSSHDTISVCSRAYHFLVHDACEALTGLFRCSDRHGHARISCTAVLAYLHILWHGLQAKVYANVYQLNERVLSATTCRPAPSCIFRAKACHTWCGVEDPMWYAPVPNISSKDSKQKDAAAMTHLPHAISPCARGYVFLDDRAICSLPFAAINFFRSLEHVFLISSLGK